jgi:hypothetical protein
MNNDIGKYLRGISPIRRCRGRQLVTGLTKLHAGPGVAGVSGGYMSFFIVLELALTICEDKFR